MQKWHYRYNREEGGRIESQDIASFLDDAGADCWQLAGVYPSYHGCRALWFFKRRAEDDGGEHERSRRWQYEVLEEKEGLIGNEGINGFLDRTGANGWQLVAITEKTEYLPRLFIMMRTWADSDEEVTREA